MAYKILSLALAFGFSGAIVLLARRIFAGWASDAAIGKGLTFSFLTIILSFVINIIIYILCFFMNAGGSSIFVEAFIRAAFCEETARFITLIMLFRSLATDDVREFAAGATALGIGFGVIENLMYLSGVENYVQLGAMRGVLSAPAHFAFGMASAYGVWMWRRGGRSFSTAAAGLSLAILLHGLYDFVLMAHSQEHPPLLYGINCLGLLIVIIVICATGLAASALFVDKADLCPPHDHRASDRLGQGWTYFADGLFMTAVFGVLSPLLLWRAGVEELAFASSMAIGVGLSLGMWSKAIRHIVEARA